MPHTENLREVEVDRLIQVANVFMVPSSILGGRAFSRGHGTAESGAEHLRRIYRTRLADCCSLLSILAKKCLRAFLFRLTVAPADRVKPHASRS